MALRGAGELSLFGAMEAEVQMTEAELDAWAESLFGFGKAEADGAGELLAEAEAIFDSPATLLDFRGVSDAIGEFVGAGIVVLTMTDCDTVNGILGLARQSRGGLLNVWEDRAMKQLEQIDPTP